MIFKHVIGPNKLLLPGCVADRHFACVDYRFRFELPEYRDEPVERGCADARRMNVNPNVVPGKVGIGRGRCPVRLVTTTSSSSHATTLP
jgi:hypothetical protein